MANTSILAAFERFWQHVVALVGNKVNVDGDTMRGDIDMNGYYLTFGRQTDENRPYITGTVDADGVPSLEILGQNNDEQIRIHSIADPVNNLDVANKSYVDTHTVNYGLGVGATQTISNIDDPSYGTGWYRYNAEIALVPSLTDGLNTMVHVEKMSDMYTIQTAYIEYYFSHGAIIIQREYAYNSVTDETEWTEWKFVNPPMEPGVEYCTTQVWEGKPVYRKLANLGSVSNGATVVWHNESNIIPLKYDSHFYAQTVPKYEHASAFFFVNVVANQAIISSAGLPARPVSITVDYVYPRG